MSSRIHRFFLPGLFVVMGLAACQSDETPDPERATASAAEDVADGATAMPETKAEPETGVGTAEGVDIADTGMDAMVKLGGAMQAAAEVCDQVSEAELDAARQQQKQMFVQRGGSEATFDAAFEQAYKDVRAKYAASSDSEREASCRELRQLSENPQLTQP